jgi:hypothetical protein
MRARMSELVQRLVVAAKRRGSESWAQAGEFDAVLDALLTDYPARLADAGEDRDELDDVAGVFGLDATDAAILWCAAAADLDANVALAYALLRGVAGLARPSVGLTLELIGVPTASAEAFERLAADGSLCRHRLLEVAGTEPWLARALQVPQPVVRALSGAEPSDPLVSPARCPVLPLTLPGGDQVGRAIERGASFVWVRSPTGAAGASLAAGAIAGIGLSWLAVDARRCAAGDDLADVMACAAREAGLRGWALVVVGADVLADGAGPSAFRALDGAAVPVVASGTRPWNPAWLPELPLVVEAEPLSPADRAQLWQSQLGDVVAADDELRQTLVGLRLTPEDVAETARYANLLGAAQDRPVSPALVRDAARRVGGTRGTSADRIDVPADAGDGPTFDDLVLPEDVLGSLRRLVNWGRHRNEVSAHGPLRRHGRGIAALFAGNPGTGKTLAAHVVAAELSVDLFQVELSAIVDKYIGETQKNLERVFQAAEALDVVLFFDEADALFGSRSEVHDARDRYANQEIAYLLQRMEQFEGITILATNLRGNLDRAFSRRMSFIVHFPDPDPETRLRLWQYHLAQVPALDRKDPIGVDYLAQAVELTGGDIRNIVLAAAYDAISAGEAVGMRHVVDATVREYRKLGKVVPDHSFTAP